MSSERVHRIEERGVYISASAGPEGYHFVYAVASWGCWLKKVITLRPHISETRAVLEMEELLDRMDPPPPERPPLKLIKVPEPPPRVPPPSIVVAVDATRRALAARIADSAQLRDPYR
jgi:hypothetical protein